MHRLAATTLVASKASSVHEAVTCDVPSALVRIWVGAVEACLHASGHFFAATDAGFPLLGICSLIVGSCLVKRGTGSIPVA